MKVDRSRFLLLAAALSANACTIINNTNADAGPDTDTGTTADTGTDATTDDSSSDTSMDVATEASADASDASDASETLCTDEGAAVTPCSGTTADGGGCVLDGVPQCTSYVSYFKPAVAKKAIDCLSALPTCEGSDAIYACGYSALEGACPDSTVDAYCTALVAACPSVDGGTDAGSIDMLTQCKLYAGGLNADGRDRLQTLVVTEGGCTTPLRDLLPNL